MEGSDGVAQVAAVDVRVDLRGADVGMAQEFLDHAEVRAARHQVRGERMAQEVRVHAADPRGKRILAHQLPDGHALERAAGVGEEQAVAVAAVVEAHEVRAQLRHVALHRVDGGLADRHDALLVALADHVDDAERLVEVVDLERAHLARAQAGGVHEFQHGAVAQPEGAVVRARGLDQFLHLARRERAGELLPRGGPLQEARRVLLQLEVGVQPAEEDAHGGQVADDGARVQPALAREVAHVRSQVVDGDVLRFAHAERDQEDEHLLQVARVRLERGGGQAGLDARERHEAADRSVELRCFGIGGRLGH